MKKERSHFVSLASTLLLCSSVLAQFRGPAPRPVRTPAQRPAPTKPAARRTAPRAHVENQPTRRIPKRVLPGSNPRQLPTTQNEKQARTIADPLRMRADRIPLSPEEREALRFRRLREKGRKLRRKISKVTRKLEWHKTLASAQKEAKKSGKPILWIHALGKLTGYT